MNISEINSINQLQRYRSDWDNLLRQTPNANFSQTFDWLEVYWKHFKDEQKLCVLVIEQDEVVTGMLPLVIRTEQTKVGKLRFVTYPLNYWGSFYGPISANPDMTWAAGLDYLQTIRSEWDVLEPRWVGAELGERERMNALLEAARLAPVCTEFDTSAVINLAGTWEEYLTSRGGKWRNNARRWERQLAEYGKIKHLRHRPTAGSDADPGWEYYDECLRIASNSWQAESTTGTTLTHDSISAFLRNTHLAAAKCGCVDMNLLFLNGQAIAFTYNYVYQGNVFSLRSGFDATCPVKGAGSLLYVKAIEDSFRRGDWRYDLGPGSIEIKRKLLTDVQPIYRISCFKRWSVRQQLMRLKRNLETGPILAAPSPPHLTPQQKHQ